MNFTQITRAITILVIFGTLAASSIFLTSMKKVQKDWPTYRCNPAIMPFAGMLGHDVMTNFTQCIGKAQQGMMGYYTAGSNYAGKLGGDVMGGMTSTVNIRLWFDFLFAITGAYRRYYVKHRRYAKGSVSSAFP